MIRVHIEGPEALDAPLRYAWRELCTRIGWGVRFVSRDEMPHIVQSLPSTAGAGRDSGSDTDRRGNGRNPLSGSGGALVLPLDPALFRVETRCQAVVVDGRTIWSRTGRPEVEGADLVGAAWRLLTFLDEGQIAESDRDRRGVFVHAALPAERRAAAEEPLVENHAELLARKIGLRFPDLEAVRTPRWPGGRRFAVVVTHDADAVRLGAPLEILNNLAKGVRRRSPLHLRWGLQGARSLVRPADDPLFAFPVWQQWEDARGLRSGFYLFHRPRGVRADRDDCRSSVAGRGTDWGRLREMAGQGWEFGLHPSIHLRKVPGAFAAARDWLENRLGAPVEGVRHHFWALDWRSPYRTHRDQHRAGFLYDSSIAWRDRPGYRAGTSLPFHACDPGTGQPLPFLVLPCGLMDRHVLYAGVGQGRREDGVAAEIAVPLVNGARASGGMIVLNWHQETAWDAGEYQGFLTTLDRLLTPLLQADDAWFATPSQVRRHWVDREHQLDTGSL